MLDRTPSSTPAVVHPEWARLGLTDVEPDVVPLGEEDLSEVRNTGRATYDPSVLRLDGFPGQDASGAGGDDAGRRTIRYRYVGRPLILSLTSSRIQATGT